jgi:ESF2/ABP1 family protein
MADKKDSKKKTSKSSFLHKDANEYREKLEKRGVIYMSRIPVYMKPNKARSLFELYGEVTRIYLSEEDTSVRKKRKEHGGNSARQFSEGWVEFAEKRIAKQVASSLNNTPIGSKKGDRYYDDLWNLKYLKSFKWDYLTEKFAYEKRVKATKVNAAMLQAKRSNAEYVELLEKTKTEAHIQERIEKRKAANGSNKSDDNEAGEEKKKKKRIYQQRHAVTPKDSRFDTSTLSKVFSKTRK